MVDLGVVTKDYVDQKFAEAEVAAVERHEALLKLIAGRPVAVKARGPSGAVRNKSQPG